MLLRSMLVTAILSSLTLGCATARWTSIAVPPAIASPDNVISLETTLLRVQETAYVADVTVRNSSTMPAQLFVPTCMAGEKAGDPLTIFGAPNPLVVVPAGSQRKFRALCQHVASAGEVQFVVLWRSVPENETRPSCDQTNSPPPEQGDRSDEELLAHLVEERMRASYCALQSARSLIVSTQEHHARGNHDQVEFGRKILARMADTVRQRGFDDAPGAVNLLDWRASTPGW